jgi:adiponectin receptor
MHTETLNIWTHVVGTTLFLNDVIAFAGSCKVPISQSMLARLVYLAAAALCFFCSTLYHIFSRSREAHFWQHVDHLGIVVFVWATSLSFVYISFREEQVIQCVYVVVITSLFIVSLMRLWGMWYHCSGSQRSRLVLHVTFGALATWPALHLWHIRANKGQELDILRAYLSLVIVNSIGGAIYATRLLDDTVGQYLRLPDLSHAIMHVMVIFGARIYQQALTMEEFENEALVGKFSDKLLRDRTYFERTPRPNFDVAVRA